MCSPAATSAHLSLQDPPLSTLCAAGEADLYLAEQPDMLWQNTASNSSPGTYACPYCDKTFKSRTRFNEHIRSVHYRLP